MKKLFAISLAAVLGFNLFAAPLNQTDKNWKTMINETVVDKGSNARLKKVIEKLRNGETVYVCGLGGSVTEGAGPADFHDGYIYQFQKLLAEKYAKNADQVVLDGAGLGGTPSPLGLIRYDQDVIADLGGHKPDVLVIEFSVNDWLECSKGRAFEALIRRGLEDNPDCAVIALYATATYANQQDWMIPIASHYSIPQVSIRNAIDKRIESGEVKKDDYFADYAHPKKDGHTFMANCLLNIFEIADKESLAKSEIPAHWKLANPLKKFRTITGTDGRVIVERGSFSEKDNATQNSLKKGKGNFPMNWHHPYGNNGAANEPLKITLKCKAFILVFKENAASPTKPFGNAQVYVDGKLVKTCDPTNKGWNNCNVSMIIDETEVKDHVIEIKMAPGSEKKAFTVVAMGYSAD